MRTAGDVVVLDVLPDRVPADLDRLADSLAGTGEAARVIVNLSSLDHVSSLFLARLLVFHKHLQQEECNLILCCLHPLVRGTLAFTRLDAILNIVDDEEGALASL